MFSIFFQDEDILIESEEEIIHDSGDHEHVQHLRAKKEELEKRVKEKTRQQENIMVNFHLLLFVLLVNNVILSCLYYKICSFYFTYAIQARITCT